MENPERAKEAEFASLRNKRAYVNAAIDSLLLAQVKSNARPVAVSDTTELERKLADERAGKRATGKAADKGRGAEQKKAAAAGGEAPKAAQKAEPKGAAGPAKPLTRREQVMADIAKGDYPAAELAIGEMLEAKPNGAMALNLKAVLEIRQGKVKDAEKTLDRAISANPRSHCAYYNMAYLLLQKGAEHKKAARRYYESGRALGGPADGRLEELTK